MTQDSRDKSAAAGPLVLAPSVQNYHWGKLGTESLGARLVAAITPSAFKADLPYAELWYGSHPRGASTIAGQQDSGDLTRVLAERGEDLLGSRMLDRFGASLPFLTKILSIRQALSIQAHPEMSAAGVLHAQDPENYPDAMHKPEIAIALSKTELLHGWISQDDYLQLKKIFPEIFNFLKKHSVNSEIWEAQTRKELIKVLYERQPAEIAGLNNMILKRLLSADKPPAHQKERLFAELSEQVDLADTGLILSMFLRHLTLEPGESMFTPPGEIHAYLSGDLLECMANSDNVIRAGLTPKHQDTKALLNYANFNIGIHFPHSPKIDQNSSFLKYPSDAREFEVSAIFESSKSLSYSKSSESPELLLVSAGKVSVTADQHNVELEAGYALLIPAATRLVRLDLQGATISRFRVPD